MAAQYSILFYHNLFNQSSIERHLGCFQYFVMTNGAVVNSTFFTHVLFSVE